VTTIFGIDYAGARPDPHCLALHGVKFVGRYVEPASDWKTLTKAEADRLHNAGIAIVSFYETSANHSLGGHAVGMKDAEGVIAHRKEIGMPDNRPFYFAVDFDASQNQLAGPITEYFQGLAHVLTLPLVGAYGGYRTIKYLFDHGLITWGHQTYAWSRIDGKVVWDKRAQLQQYKNGQSICDGNKDVDFDRAMVPDYGQWPAPSSNPPKPQPPKEALVDWNPSAQAVATVKDAPNVKDTRANKWNTWAVIAMLKTIQEQNKLPITGLYDQATAEVIDATVAQ
jgi:hypothetical protein